jgi:hypothetical protein
VIYAFDYLGEIEEPNLKDFAGQFNESGFEIYTSQALANIDDDVQPLSRDFKAKLVTSETLDSILAFLS